MLVDIDIIMRVFMKKPCENSLISSLSLLVKSFEEEIQPSGDRVDTARG